MQTTHSAVESPPTKTITAKKIDASSGALSD